MSKRLRIAIADDEPDMREFFDVVLRRLGHDVVAVASNGSDLVDRCRECRPDLAITDIKMDVLDGLDAARRIYEDRPIPIVVVTGHHDPGFIERAGQNHVLAYLIKPIREVHLAPAIAIAMQRFEEFQALRREAEDLRQTLQDRKLIERAKGILMKQAKLDENDAFRRLQKLASQKRRRMADVARSIIEAAEAFEQAGDADAGAR